MHTAALKKWFGSPLQAELHCLIFNGRIHRQEESLPELLEDIERLVDLAYPGMSAEMLELLAKDQSIAALTDRDVMLRLNRAAQNLGCSLCCIRASALSAGIEKTNTICLFYTPCIRDRKKDNKQRQKSHNPMP